VAVVEVERRGEAALGQAELPLELARCVAHRGHRIALVGRLLEHGVVHHEPSAAVPVQERRLAESSVVGILVHEALAERVDEHAALESPGLRDGQ
jgi:hypothetical protein